MPHYGAITELVKAGRKPKQVAFDMSGRVRDLPYPGDSALVRIDKNEDPDCEWWWLPLYELRPVYMAQLPQVSRRQAARR